MKIELNCEVDKHDRKARFAFYVYGRKIQLFDYPLKSQKLNAREKKERLLFI